RLDGSWCSMRAHSVSSATLPAGNTLEQFITEHYWGYSSARNGRSREYRVEHPRWNVWKCEDAHFEGDTSSLYGPELATVVRRPPDSAFVADGSTVTVFSGETFL